MFDCVTSAGPGDHAGDGGKRGADPEHQHEDASDVVTEMADHVRMGQRGLDDQADPRLLQDDQQPDEDHDRHQQHEHLVGGIIGGEDRERREIEQRRDAEIDRALAPDDLHDLLDHEGEAEGEQQFGDMAVLVDAAQAVALDAGADRAGQQGRNQQRRPEPEPPADLETEEGAEHVEARMREIEHAQHAEDDGEAARHQKQQHAEQDAVERGYDDQFKHRPTASEIESGIRPGRRRGEWNVRWNDQLGRSILQVVGKTVCGASILRDAASSPSRSFPRRTAPYSVRSPNEAMYIGWKN